MPDEPWIWVLAIVIGGAVLLFALRRGGNVRARVGGVSLESDARKEPETAEVSVLDKGRIRESKVGDVTGISGAPTPAGTARVEVAKGAEISGSEVGDISGVRVDGERPGGGRERADEP
jgi:hypothetical protein